MDTRTCCPGGFGEARVGTVMWLSEPEHFCNSQPPPKNTGAHSPKRLTGVGVGRAVSAPPTASLYEAILLESSAKELSN